MTSATSGSLSAALSAGRPLVMGILNVTPDSFSDGGRFADPARALAQAAALAAEGAALVDVGGESTRPGHSPVSLEEERARVLPVLAALALACPVPVSIDTTKAALAREALALGVAVVNDQWGFQGDPAMADVVAEAGATAVLMHNRASVEDGVDIEAELLRFFERSLARAARAGIPATRLILDPGIGFGKTPPQQIAALRAIPALGRAFGRPVLVGASRKSLLGRLTGAPVERRLPETLAAHLVAFGWGARLFRVHDVGPHVAALTVATALADPAGTPPMIEIGLGLGSNIGDKAGHVRRAAELLSGRGIATGLVLSALYRTPPWGHVPQDWFVNACAVGRTTLSPIALLEAVKALEVEIGRTATVRWGPRVIDIDILYFGGLALDSPDLVLPHRELVRRAFVLIPLAELRPELRLAGARVADLAASLDDGSVQPLAEPPST